MSSVLARPRQVIWGGQRVAPRALLLIALLALEIVGLSLRIDTGRMSVERTWGLSLLQPLAQVARLGIAMCCGVVLVLVLSGTGRASAPRNTIIEPVRHAWRTFLIFHLAAFALFAVLSQAVIEGDTRSWRYPGLGIAAWFIAGATTLGFWAFTVAPVSAWWDWARSRWRRVALGVLVGALGWQASYVTRSGWELLGGSTFGAAEWLLTRVTADVVSRPAEQILGTSRFVVQISAECSGFEGMGLITVFLGLYLWVTRERLRFPRALLLVPLGVAAIWALNAVRIACLILIGDRYSPAVAVGGFHSQAGWLAFNAVGLGMAAAARDLRFFQKGERTETHLETTNPTAAYLAPMMAILATMMVTGAFSSGFDWLYPLRVPAALAALWFHRGSYKGLFDARVSWSAVGVGVLVFVVWLAIEPRPVSATISPIEQGLKELPRYAALLWIVSRVVGSVVLVPIAEELAFRGYLARRLMAADFDRIPLGRYTAFSFVGSSLVFGALHGRWFAGTLAGMAYAVTLWHRGSLKDAVLAHAVTNGLIAGTVLVLGSWSLWS